MLPADRVEWVWACKMVLESMYNGSGYMLLLLLLQGWSCFSVMRNFALGFCHWLAGDDGPMGSIYLSGCDAMR